MTDVVSDDGDNVDISIFSVSRSFTRLARRQTARTMIIQRMMHDVGTVILTVNYIHTNRQYCYDPKFSDSQSYANSADLN